MVHVEQVPTAVERHEDVKVEMNKSPEKTKEEILAERQAKKTAKKPVEVKEVKPVLAKKESPPAPVVFVQPSPAKPHECERTKEQIHAEREAKKLAKQAAKKKVVGGVTPTVTPVKPSAPSPKLPVTKQGSDAELAVKMEKLHIEESDERPGKKVLSKAERRSIQEAQRAAKAKAVEEKKTPAKTAEVKKTPAKKVSETPAKKLLDTPMKGTVAKPSAVHKVKLFKHLYVDKCDYNINVNQQLHPAIVKLGLQYASDSVVGSNARCYAFLNAMKIVSFCEFKELTLKISQNLKSN